MEEMESEWRNVICTEKQMANEKAFSDGWLVSLCSQTSQVTDLVAIRHLVGAGADGKTEQRTTLILLCDDGSLRIFMASPETTSFWLSPTIQPPLVAPHALLRHTRTSSPLFFSPDRVLLGFTGFYWVL